MKITQRKLSTISPYPANAKKHPAKHIKQVAETLLKIDGQTRVFDIMKNILLGRQQVTNFVCR